ncbi:MAG TPA: sulfotransferase [Planctomycetota bacterium]|nr:sulfotransferase [Planctomycetota bacterium]
MTTPSSDSRDFAGWVPFGVRFEAGGARVDWTWLGERRCVEPFFDQTVAALRAQEDVSKRYRESGAEALEQVGERLAPSGFVYHLSRCGSTLVAQILAALESTVVISEPNVVNALLERSRAGAERAEIVGLLRGAIGALGQKRTARERHYFLKFSSRAIHELALIREAFPDVPWVFLYRDPVEVLAAHVEHSRGRLAPGLAESGLAEGDAAELRQMAPAEFWARALRNCCAAALRFCGDGRSLLVNYEQLPDVVWGGLAQFFGVDFSAEEIEAMRCAARFDAKNPGRVFEGDREQRRAAGAEVREMAERWVMAQYRRLEDKRGRSGPIQEPARI